MTKHVAASVFACVVLLLLQYGLLDTLAAMQLQSLPSAKVYQPPTPDTLRVVLLGSASGPRWV